MPDKGEWALSKPPICTSCSPPLIPTSIPTIVVPQCRLEGGCHCSWRPYGPWGGGTGHQEASQAHQEDFICEATGRGGGKSLPGEWAVSPVSMLDIRISHYLLTGVLLIPPPPPCLTSCCCMYGGKPEKRRWMLHRLLGGSQGRYEDPDISSARPTLGVRLIRKFLPGTIQKASAAYRITTKSGCGLYASYLYARFYGNINEKNMKNNDKTNLYLFFMFKLSPI